MSVADYPCPACLPGDATAFDDWAADADGELSLMFTGPQRLPLCFRVDAVNTFRCFPRSFRALSI